MIRPAITYFFRHSLPEYHSIEQVFEGLADYINYQDNSSKVKKIYCEYSTITPLNVVRNCLNAWRHQGNINHITGDVHYLALALPRQTAVLTIHDCILLTRSSKWNPIHWFHYFLWYKWPIIRAKKVITISNKSRDELIQAVGKRANKTYVISNYYNPSFTYSPKIFNSIYPTILHLGTAPHKNLNRLIVAITTMPCHLIIVGKLTKIQHELLQSYQIDYEQHLDINQNEIMDLYERSDLVAFVSLYEGFGLPILEGQAVGRPVVTSNISPMNIVGGSGACYVEPTNIADIRRGILRVCQDEKYRNELIRVGRLNASHYSVEHVAAQYMALYDSMEA